jgi:hypothetical protein
MTRRFEMHAMTRRLAMRGITVCLGLWLGLAGVAPGQGRQVKVSVVDAGGLPVEGATVAVVGSPGRTVTDGSGVAVVAVPAGAKAIRATAGGMDSGMVAVAAGDALRGGFGGGDGDGDAVDGHDRRVCGDDR